MISDAPISTNLMSRANDFTCLLGGQKYNSTKTLTASLMASEDRICNSLLRQHFSGSIADTLRMGEFFFCALYSRRLACCARRLRFVRHQQKRTAPGQARTQGFWLPERGEQNEPCAQTGWCGARVRQHSVVPAQGITLLLINGIKGMGRLDEQLFLSFMACGYICVILGNSVWASSIAGAAVRAQSLSS